MAKCRTPRGRGRWGIREMVGTTRLLLLACFHLFLNTRFIAGVFPTGGRRCTRCWFARGRRCRGKPVRVDCRRVGGVKGEGEGDGGGSGARLQDSGVDVRDDGPRGGDGDDVHGVPRGLQVQGATSLGRGEGWGGGVRASHEECGVLMRRMLSSHVVVVCVFAGVNRAIFT